MGIAVINYTEENVPFVLRWKMKYIFYLTVKSIMNLGKIFWVLALTGGGDTDRVVYLKEIFNTALRKLAQYIEKAYDLRTSGCGVIGTA